MVKLVSYNCRGISVRHPTKNNVVNKLLESSDILCLQETWLWVQDLPRLNNLSKLFFGDGVATRDTSDGIFPGHPPGGAAILWRKELDPLIKVMKFQHDWIIGINMTMPPSHGEGMGKEVIILNIYLPTCSRENVAEFSSKLDQLRVILDDIESPSVILIGDFNANIYNNNISNFGELLIEFIEDVNMNFTSRELLPAGTYTFISDVWHSCSWLDHVVATYEARQCIESLTVRKDLAFSDHLPIEMNFVIERMTQFQDNDTWSSQSRGVRWDEITDHDANLYRNFTSILGNAIVIPDVVHCRDLNCNDPIHINAIAEFYSKILNCINEAAGFIAPPPKGSSNANNSSNNRKRVPGWNAYVEEHHENSRVAFQLWDDHGRPRHGPIFELKKRAQARYKYAIRFIKRNSERIKNDNMALKFINNDHSVWRDINRDSNPRLPIPNKIDDICGSSNIADFWKQHYSNIYNCVQNSSYSFTHDFAEHELIPVVSLHEIYEAIYDIKNVHSKGLDGLTISHFKLASRKMIIFLSLCFQSMLVHGYIPDQLMLSSITPIVKDKRGSFTTSSNYRPISVASVVAKIFERIILNRIHQYLTSNHNQFGFKAKHGTDMAIYLIKETLTKYVECNSLVFMCLLDASKAFDRVHHGKLFGKLIDRGVPYYIVRILAYWYAEQNLCVTWGPCISGKFRTTNGVRQGSVISPLLYNVYVDQLSERLNDLPIGCVVGDKVMNHVCYADDLILISPSSSGMRRLLKTCSAYGISHDIIFNASKSVSMMFGGRSSPVALGAGDLVFDLNGVSIPQKRVARYLGYLINDELSDDDDITDRLKFIFSQGNKLIKFFSNCSKFIKVKLVKTYLSQIFCVHLWTNFKKQSFSKLKSAYNSVIRRLFWVPRFTEGPGGELVSFSASGMLVPLNINGIDILRRISIYRFCLRLISSDNSFIGGALLLLPRSSIWQSWMAALHVNRPGPGQM